MLNEKLCKHLLNGKRVRDLSNEELVEVLNDKTITPEVFIAIQHHFLYRLGLKDQPRAD